MGTIIALWHKASMGKTSTLIELKKLICNEYFCNVIFEKNYGDKDFLLVAKIFGKTIGIESMGDPDSGVKARLQDLFDKYTPDYVFCATRTSGETVSDVLSFKDQGVNVIWDSTYQIYDEGLFDFFNKLKAAHLFDLLKSLILNDEDISKVKEKYKTME